MASLSNVIARVYTALPPRAYEAASIILISTGINLITARIAPPVFDHISISGVSLIISGTLLFFAAGRVEQLYAVGQRRAQESPYQDMSVADIAFIALKSRFASANTRWRDALLLLAILVFLIAGVVFFSYRLS